MTRTLLSARIAPVSVLLVATALLAGCASKKDVNQQPEAYFEPVKQEVDPIAPMTLRVVGYGATEVASKSKSDAQRRLLAIRAARMDAYRAMAERVYGMSVQGSTTVRDMVVQNDRFRSLCGNLYARRPRGLYGRDAGWYGGNRAGNGD